MENKVYRKDPTVDKNYIKNWLFMVSEYELIKAKKHSLFRKLNDFYKHHNICRQNFLKYYNRYKQSGEASSFFPQSRAPRYKARRPDVVIEDAVIEERKRGLNKFEIHELLKPRFGAATPSPSGMYFIFRRNNLNKLTEEIKSTKRKIIKEKLGELAHIDCHYIPDGIVDNSRQKYYLLSVVDDHSRIAWSEVIKDLTSLTAMFAILRCFNALKIFYGIEIKEVMTDNGGEMGSGKYAKNVMTNPVKRLFFELDIKQRFTRPYHPQTNGKVERLWRTINEEFVTDSVFGTEEELKDELIRYVVYYNEHRVHQGIDGKKPVEMLEASVI